MSPLAALSGLSARIDAAVRLREPTQDNRFAAYRTPNVPPECRAAVYDDPEVRHLIAAGTAVPEYMAENQNKLAFKEADAERRCMQQRGLMPAGGVEPVKYPWYPPLF